MQNVVLIGEECRRLFETVTSEKKEGGSGSMLPGSPSDSHKSSTSSEEESEVQSTTTGTRTDATSVTPGAVSLDLATPIPTPCMRKSPFQAIASSTRHFGIPQSRASVSGSSSQAWPSRPLSHTFSTPSTSHSRPASNHSFGEGQFLFALISHLVWTRQFRQLGFLTFFQIQAHFPTGRVPLLLVKWLA